jgi:hypothetical protein
MHRRKAADIYNKTIKINNLKYGMAVASRTCGDKTFPTTRARKGVSNGADQQK